MNDVTPLDFRSATHEVDPLFLERWSPRAFTGEPVSEADLLTILEAAHWAPSAFNAQPWRFVYALKGSPDFDRLLDLLNPFNQVWANKAGALVFIFSKTHYAAPGAASETPLGSHSFDAGAAWGLLSLQARLLGYHTHAMAGVERDRIPAELGLPEGLVVEAAVAIGHRNSPESLPEKLKAREVPSTRRPLAEVAFAGRFAAA